LIESIIIFTEGSMAPKIRAAIHFVEHTGKDTIITSADKLGVDDGGDEGCDSVVPGVPGVPGVPKVN